MLQKKHYIPIPSVSIQKNVTILSISSARSPQKPSIILASGVVKSSKEILQNDAQKA